MTYQVGDGSITETLRVGAGSSMQPLAFFAATGSSQMASASQAAIISTAAVSVSATQWAFGTSTQANGLLNLVTEMRSALVAYGLMKGSS